MKVSTKAKLMTLGLTAAGLVTGVSATPLIANDSLEGLGAAGSNISDFMKNLAPGIFALLLLLGLAVGIVAIIHAVMTRIRGGVGGKKHF